MAEYRVPLQACSPKQAWNVRRGPATATAGSDPGAAVIYLRYDLGPSAPQGSRYCSYRRYRIAPTFAFLLCTLGLLKSRLHDPIKDHLTATY